MAVAAPTGLETGAGTRPEKTETGLPTALLKRGMPGTAPRRLRRDGERPLRFEGTPLLDRRLGTAGQDRPEQGRGNATPLLRSVKGASPDDGPDDGPTDRQDGDVPEAAGCGRLALYLASDGRIAAEITGTVTALGRDMTPDGLRPVHGAAWIASPADLVHLLKQHGLPQEAGLDDTGLALAGPGATDH